ncbi:O-acetyl-L-homoserine sulfhydrylase 2 [Frankliniella fusca]|uniref:O-acetyl-L-homoserine sulfhydrylase 2 n=1 Tax=Frankliniella fusca TaxID=407009 RepID=A0AAE1HN13_9NEOP|nr:O-acetyl-L-homoserine sulfhydrylase 2 [Frankliniella fusca]
MRGETRCERDKTGVLTYTNYEQYMYPVRKGFLPYQGHSATCPCEVRSSMFTKCGQSLSTASKSGGPCTIQPVSSFTQYDLEVEPNEFMHLKKEVQGTHDYGENPEMTAAVDTSTITTTAIKIEVEETGVKTESHHDTFSGSLLAKDVQDSFLAYNYLLSRMDDLMQNVPRQARPCYYLTSLLLQCPACAKAYKGGRYRLQSLLNHIKDYHTEMRSKLLKVVRERYTVRKKCDCFACYVNRASKHPKDRSRMFKRLSDYSKSFVLENFQNLKVALKP